MPVQLFRLRNVPDDEAEEIRQLLIEHGIEFYETPAGNWGISMPSIWLNDETQSTRAKALIESYQKQRAIRKRQEYEQLKREGKQRTIADTLREQPFLLLLYLAVAGLILYLSLKPFLDLGNS